MGKKETLHLHTVLVIFQTIKPKLQDARNIYLRPSKVTYLVYCTYIGILANFLKEVRLQHLGLLSRLATSRFNTPVLEMTHTEKSCGLEFLGWYKVCEGETPSFSALPTYKDKLPCMLKASMLGRRLSCIYPFLDILIIQEWGRFFLMNI